MDVTAYERRLNSASNVHTYTSCHDQLQAQCSKPLLLQHLDCTGGGGGSRGGQGSRTKWRWTRWRAGGQCSWMTAQPPRPVTEATEAAAVDLPRPKPFSKTR